MSAELSLRDLDALELVELLEFVRDFLTVEHAVVAPALEHFAHPYPLGELRADLARFVFLLGGEGTRFIEADPS
jgi:hypothetical protein